jgi:hypothetical protein
MNAVSALILAVLASQAAVVGTTTAPAASSPSKPGPALTCAVLADRASGLGESPLVALVEARLAQQKGLTLLERGRIDELLKEQELEAALGADAGARRVALGRLLKVDVLVMFSRVKQGKGRVPQVIICETKAGIRLRVETLPSDKDDDEARADAVAAWCAQAREKMSLPDWQVVAVPPFVSQDFLWDNDFLKSMLANVVQQYLLSWQGVVVVEIDEARAIAEELRLAGTESGVKRPLPLYIMGEYKSERPSSQQAEGGDEDTTISLKMGLYRGTTLMDEQSAAKIPLQAILPTVGTLVRGLPLKRECRNGRSDPVFEARQLHQRAKVFMETASWRNALDLVEAAVLLTPDDADLHLTALQILPRLEAELPGQQSRLFKRRYTKGLADIDLVRLGFFHIERYLEITPVLGCDSRATELIQDMFPKPLWAALTNEDADVLAVRRKLLDQGQNMLFRILARKLREGQASTELISGMRFWLDCTNSKGNLWRLIEALQNEPTMAQNIAELIDVRLGGVFGRDPKNRFDLDRYDCERLLSPEVSQQIAHLSTLPGVAAQSAAEYLRGCRTTAMRRIEHVDDAQFEGALKDAENRRQFTWVAFRTQDGDVERKRLTKGSFTAAIDDASRSQVGVVTIQPVQLKCGIGGGEVPGDSLYFLGWGRCGDGIDFAWTPDAILLMKKKGDLKAVFQTDETVFYDSHKFPAFSKTLSVVFDGKYLWAPARFAKEPYIVAIDPVGEKVFRIDRSKGLPPLDRDLWLAPVGPGRVCLTAAFGRTGTSELDRSWCGVLELDSTSKCHVRTLLEVNRQVVQGAREEMANSFRDPALAFEPQGIVPIPGPDSDGITHVVLLRTVLGNRTVDYQPLLIDLGTGVASEFKMRLPRLEPGAVMRDGAVLYWTGQDPLSPSGSRRTVQIDLRTLEASAFGADESYGHIARSTEPPPVVLLGPRCIRHEGFIHMLLEKNQWGIGKDLLLPIQKLDIAVAKSSWQQADPWLAESNFYGILVLSRPMPYIEHRLCQAVFDVAALSATTALLTKAEAEAVLQRKEDAGNAEQLRATIARNMKAPLTIEGMEDTNPCLVYEIIGILVLVAALGIGLMLSRRANGHRAVAVPESSENQEAR